MYLLIRAARYLGVAPWELRKVGSHWRNWALMSEECELKAEAYHAESLRRKQSH